MSKTTIRDIGKIFYEGSEAYTPEYHEHPRLTPKLKPTKRMIREITGGWVRSPKYDAHAEPLSMTPLTVLL